MKTRGFTLIELLVVIAIIGVLSSIVFTSLSSARSKARDAKRFSDMHSIQTALEIYATNHGAYPASTPGGSGCWWVWEGGNTANSGGWLAPLVSDGEFSAVPKENTLTGCTYRYVLLLWPGQTTCGSPSGTYAVVYALFENPTPPSCHPSCTATWSGWNEASASDPNGCLLVLPQ